MKTYQPKASEIKRDWHLLDAQNQVLGRLAARIAVLLMGKHKPTFAPHLDGGDYVVVTNCSQMRVTGKKMRDKIYYWHTGYMGGLKQARLEELMAKHPERVIWLAVKNMLPKNKLRKGRLKRLKIFTGGKHPYQDKIQKSKIKNQNDNLKLKKKAKN